VQTLKDVPFLNEQEAYIKNKYPKIKIITDIGTGFDFNRHGFLKLFSMILSKKINKLILFSKNSIIPTGYNFIKKLINEYNRGQIIIEKYKKTINTSFQEDLKYIIPYYD
jgi:predicted site-specific integrase-resolvase